jgi:hypothetical protein
MYTSVVLLLFILGCGSSPFEVSYREISRLSSPDQFVDALIVEANGGATTPFIYDIYVVPKGKSFQKDSCGNCLFSADHIDSLTVNWKSNRFLEIQYKQARIFSYSNFWQSNELFNYHYVVEVRLKPLIEVSSLSEEDRGIIK